MNSVLDIDYSVTQKSHQGGRDYNEDRTAIFEKNGTLFLVLGDGLGGHAGGEIASQALIDALGDSFHKASDEQPFVCYQSTTNWLHHKRPH